MQTVNGGRSYQCTIRFTLLTSFNECSERRVLGGSPMDRIFVEMDRGGRGVLTHGKRQPCAYCQYSNLPAYSDGIISLSFFTF